MEEEDLDSAIEEELEALEALYPGEGLVIRRADPTGAASAAPPPQRRGGGGGGGSGGRGGGRGGGQRRKKDVDDARHTRVALDITPRTLEDRKSTR